MMDEEQPSCPICGYPTYTGEHGPHSPHEESVVPLAEMQAPISALTGQKKSAAEQSTEGKFRSELLERSAKTLADRGYVVTADAPYKSFGTRERFLIRRAIDKDGRDVVVKVAAPEARANAALEKEKTIISAIGEACARARAAGREPGVEFPVLTDAWDAEGSHGMATEFVADDVATKATLDAEDRARVLRRVIDGLHALDVPPELAATGQRTLDGTAHIDRAERFMEAAGDSLTEAEKSEILDLFQVARELFDRLPLKLAHGDLHGQNLAYRRDKGGIEHVTVMDLEALRANNEYYDWATTANLASFGADMEKHAAGLDPALMERLRKSWIDATSVGLDGYVEREVIAKDARGQDAEMAYRLMRITHALEKLSNAKGNDSLMKLQREVTSGIIRQQLGKLRSASGDS